MKRTMDDALAERLNSLDAQNKKLTLVRGEYLLRESQRKHFEASLIRAAAGKSHAEKVINAQATKEWAEFHREIATLQNNYEFEKLKYEILDKAWLAEHLSLKLDATTIQRSG